MTRSITSDNLVTGSTLDFLCANDGDSEPDSESQTQDVLYRGGNQAFDNDFKKTLQSNFFSKNQTRSTSPLPPSDTRLRH
jgi:hypothetical protein